MLLLPLCGRFELRVRNIIVYWFALCEMGEEITLKA